jgi:hypothetical protein
MVDSPEVAEIPLVFSRSLATVLRATQVFSAGTRRVPVCAPRCWKLCCDSGGVRRYMSEQRAHRMNEWIDGLST